MLHKLSEQSCWKMKCKAMNVSETVLEKENQEMDNYLQRLTKVYDEGKAERLENEDNLKTVQERQAAKDKKQQDIDELEKNYIELKATSELYRNINQDDIALKDEYELLRMKKGLILQKIQKLEKPDEEIEQETPKSELEQEHFSLCDEVVELECRIAKKKALKEQLRKVRLEEQSFTDRQARLKRDISDLNVICKKEVVDETKIEKLNTDLSTMHEEDKALQFQFDDTFTAVLRQNEHQITNKNTKRKIQEMTKLNNSISSHIQGLEENTREKNLKMRSGLSSGDLEQTDL
ncbi:hypothetical protein WMY93_008874 [Mugilogobius chulae]|uniref:Uncharacterized protein n=1 Tax=Mugilogobius chulae TaxID=88201 RepID=A0AAW0PF63_9GOBI